MCEPDVLSGVRALRSSIVNVNCSFSFRGLVNSLGGVVGVYKTPVAHVPQVSREHLNCSLALQIFSCVSNEGEILCGLGLHETEFGRPRLMMR